MRFYGHVARVLAVSRAIADAIIAQAPQLQPKIRVIPNPVPFQIGASPGSGRSYSILFVGRIHPEKGIELLVRAFAGLPAQLSSNWKLKIVGPHETHLGGGGADFLRAMQRLGGPIEWLGPIFDEAELRAQYRRAMIFAYPSLAETGEAFPVAPLEAMANGCVPLVSQLACFDDYIENGITGFIFNHRGNGEKALTDCLDHLLRLHPNELSKIGDAARAKAAEFALEPVARRYLDDFASLLEDRE
jgi:glycosyltransferase involved in cell wall biosynthesis